MDPEESEVRQLFLKFSQKLVDLIGSQCGVDHTAVSVGLRIHDLGDLQKQDSAAAKVLIFIKFLL